MTNPDIESKIASIRKLAAELVKEYDQKPEAILICIPGLDSEVKGSEETNVPDYQRMLDRQRKQLEREKDLVIFGLRKVNSVRGELIDKMEKERHYLMKWIYFLAGSIISISAIIAVALYKA